MYGEAQRILYDPVSWVHPNRLPVMDSFSPARCQSILNDIILEQFKLSTKAIDPGNSRERYIISHWALLPSAAFMAVCHRHRAKLVRSGLITKLDNRTQQFALSCLLGSECHINETLSLQELALLACREAMIFSRSLSVAIRERIPLLFAHSPASLDVDDYGNNSDDTLLRMAIQHAKRTQ